MSETKEATPEQLRIAKAYKIPKKLAHTINVEKARAYREWLRGEGGIEMFLHEQELKRGHL